MNLLKEVQKVESRLPKLYANEKRKPEDVEIIIKFFDPTGSWTWYVTEGEKRGGEDYLFFGLVRGFDVELGYFCLSELAGIKGRLGLGIEVDKHFGKRYLNEAMEKQI